MTGLAVGTTQGTAKAAADGASLLEVRGLGIALPDGAGQMQRIVHDVSLTVGRGQRVALVGESGSGKTLTAHALMRLTEGAKYDGQILFEGQDVLTADERTLRTLRGGQMGMVFQEPMSALKPLHPIGDQSTTRGSPAPRRWHARWSCCSSPAFRTRRAARQPTRTSFRADSGSGR